VSVDADSPSRAAAADAAALEAFAPAHRDLVARAVAYARPVYGERTLPTGERVLDHALETAVELAALRLDPDSLAAAVLYAMPTYVPGYRDGLASAFGDDVTGIVANIERLNQLRIVTRGATAPGASAERASQVEVLRKMLLAMVEDIRAVLIRLASRTRTLHHLDGAPEATRVSIARETLDIYAPLANRLGVWQLKSQLEDLAFRHAEPEAHARIEALLDEGEAERASYIARAIATLRDELERSGIRAEISGRPKHLYSIWNKMRRKGREFSDLSDLRAVRVIVTDVRECYTVLGIVHNLWQPIPKEFDDYISRPKANAYRSLHTAVVALDGRPLEVQIRTAEMHRQAEGGVAAHWRYKESGRSERTRDARAAGYEERIAWLRQILAWRDEVVDGAEWVDQAKHAAISDTVYVLSPQGRVVELPRGSTPIDFAFHVHTDLGYRCRGAKVDGAMVPLDYRLENGQTVEIQAAKQGGPSRDWLNAERGYLGSPRARTKVRQWFNAAESEAMTAAGRAAVERELQREGRTGANLEELARRLGFDATDAMYIAVAREDVGPRQLQVAIRDEAPPAAPPDEVQVKRGVRSEKAESGILVVGIDRLLTQLARCCRPVPPDPIVGFVTRGRGVSIHRRSCSSVSQLTKAHPERVIEADWGAQSSAGVYAVDLRVQAHDRQGLLRDISDVFTRERVNVIGVNTQSRAGIAMMQFTVEVSEMAMVTRALERIREVAGVFSAGRR